MSDLTVLDNSVYLFIILFWDRLAVLSAVEEYQIINCCWDDHSSCFLYLDKPKITSFNSDKKNNISPVGKTVTITCVAEAFPSPNYKIFYNDVKLADVVDGVKTIQSANLGDDGRYECLAKNSVGNISESFNLIVNGKICVKTVLIYIWWKSNKIQIEIIKIFVLVKIIKSRVYWEKICANCVLW